MIVIPECAFAAYVIKDDNILISEMFVTKNNRRDGVGSFLLEQIRNLAKTKNKKYITCTVDTSTDCADLSEKAIRAAGFMLLKKEGNGLYFYKEV